mmetsp:Transcript_48396/g.128411  ORF Transcript_48396/g.128411 Transcript_48396/m.128411 type:complete len:335 (-) Transcript_48396:183-1187(-)
MEADTEPGRESGWGGGHDQLLQRQRHSRWYFARGARIDPSATIRKYSLGAPPSHPRGAAQIGDQAGDVVHGPPADGLVHERLGRPLGGALADLPVDEEPGVGVAYGVPEPVAPDDEGRVVTGVVGDHVGAPRAARALERVVAESPADAEHPSDAATAHEAAVRFDSLHLGLIRGPVIPREALAAPGPHGHAPRVSHVGDMDARPASGAVHQRHGGRAAAPPRAHEAQLVVHALEGARQRLGHRLVRKGAIGTPRARGPQLVHHHLVQLRLAVVHRLAPAVAVVHGVEAPALTAPVSEHEGVHDHGAILHVLAELAVVFCSHVGHEGGAAVVGEV